MSDTYSGSSPMNFLISPVRPFNLLRSLESQENLPENGVRDAAEEDTAIEIKNSRKRSKPGSSTRIGSEETRNVYEQVFMMASQRESGHIFEPIVGTNFDSEVDAIHYYNTYSWEVGFGIRKGKKYVNSEKYKTMQTLLCSCEVYLCPLIYMSPFTLYIIIIYLRTHTNKNLILPLGCENCHMEQLLVA